MAHIGLLDHFLYWMDSDKTVAAGGLRLSY